MLEIKEKITYMTERFDGSSQLGLVGILLTIAIFYDLQEPAGCLNGDLIFILTIFLIIALLRDENSLND